MPSNPHLSSATLEPHKESGLPTNPGFLSAPHSTPPEPSIAATMEGDLASSNEPGDGEQPAAEKTLTHRISELWGQQIEHASSLKMSKAELASLRLELAAQLFDLKNQFARTGRNGCWTPFLKSKKIPRATADRYVNRHRAAMEPAAANRLTEAIHEPTPTEVTSFLKKLTPKLRARLTTSAAVTQFLKEITVILSKHPDTSCLIPGTEIHSDRS